MSDFEREREMEDAFRRRYNRNVKVYSKRVKENDKIKSCTVDIEYRNKHFFITEYLDKYLKTDYCIVAIGDIEMRYDKYLEAEVNVADAIGSLG